jgi:hypothetical protein
MDNVKLFNIISDKILDLEKELNYNKTNYYLVLENNIDENSYIAGKISAYKEMLEELNII